MHSTKCAFEVQNAAASRGTWTYALDDRVLGTNVNFILVGTE